MRDSDRDLTSLIVVRADGPAVGASDSGKNRASGPTIRRRRQ